MNIIQSRITFISSRKVYFLLNTILGRVVKSTSKKAAIQLVTQKRLWILLYGIEACPLNKSMLDSFDLFIANLQTRLICFTIIILDGTNALFVA